MDDDQYLEQELTKPDPVSAGHCPVGCGRVLPSGKVTCGPCWREVPRHLQREVYAAWRAVCRDLTGANIRRHREAKDAAIGSIR